MALIATLTYMVGLVFVLSLTALCWEIIRWLRRH